MNYKLFSLIFVLLLGFCAAGSLLHSSGTSHNSGRPDLEYLKALNEEAPPEDPQVLFLLMAQYASANRQAEGAAFFSERLKEFEPRLTKVQKALYLSAIGMLRAQHAQAVPIVHRINWVNQTIAMLDQARQLSGGQVFVVNWIGGTVRAQIPSHFHQKAVAAEQLKWCLDHADKAPHVGWLREIYFQMAKLASADGDAARAQDYLHRSGYPDLNKQIVLNTAFSENLATGHAFCPKRIAEVVPHRVYVLSGFEFTEYYFVVSEDRKELIGIDAGTRPDSAKAAYEALRAYAPDLPKLTTIFVTHAHWDHVGGHNYFRSLNPSPRFYARSNYNDELALELNAPGNLARHFFGERFNPDDVRTFKADVTVEHSTKLNVGGTRIELIPIQGGETADGMYISVPDLGVLFVGDFIMPYLGAPFVEEGNLDGLLSAIDVVVEKQPKYLLHGHEPLTRMFASPAMLAQLKTDLAWLRDQVLIAIRRGDDNATIQQANLIPPELIAHHPGAHIPYLLLREHVIDRLYRQNVGYWQADLTGIFHIGNADKAEALVDYLGVTDRQFVNALERMIADGKYELAASLLEASGDRFDHSEAVRKAQRLVYLKLMEQNQNSDPFKFLLFSARAGVETPQMSR
jgi:glyoxylase-like metal-dependent hydrolase (beta-lactamase superfamily II)